jgi:hypothetical protein
MRTLILIILLTANQASAEVNKAKLYGPACGAVIAAGAMTTVGLPFALVSCFSSIWIMENSDDKQAIIETKTKMEKLEMEVNERLTKDNESHTDELLLFRDSIRKVIASKIVESDIKMKYKTLEFLQSEAFQIQVRKKVALIIQDESLKIAKKYSVALDKRMINKISAKVVEDIIERNADKTEKQDKKEILPDAN